VFYDGGFCRMVIGASILLSGPNGDPPAFVDFRGVRAPHPVG